MARAALVALVLAALGLVGSGCGEEEGVADGAVVTAYVEAPLCAGTEGRVEKVAIAEGGTVEVRFTCLAEVRGKRGVELATVGANARRASEDSTTIAYIGERGTPALFSRPILEAAGIGWISANSRAEAMAQLRPALAAADSSSLRADVREALGQP